MIKLFALFALVFVSAIAYPQQRNRDSLLRVLENTGNDSSKVILLDNLSKLYTYNNPDSALSLGLQALDLSDEIDFERGIMSGLARIGNAYLWMGNYPKALQAFVHSLKIAQEIHDLPYQQDNLNNIGIVYKEQGDYREAINYYQKSKLLAEENADKYNIANVLINAGQSYMYLKVFDSARLSIQQAFEIATSIEADDLLAQCNGLFGDIYAHTSIYSLALEYYRLSLSQSIKADDYLTQCYDYLGMARVFELTARPDSTTVYAEQALILSKEKNFLKSVPDASLMLYSVYKSKGHFDRALFYHEIATAANDSLYSLDNLNELRSISFDEKLREIQLEDEQEKANTRRERNLQYVAVAIAIIAFIIIFLVFTTTIIINEKLISFFGILGLLAVFEFISLLIHPTFEEITHHSVFWMLLMLMAMGALLVPLHHKLEHWIKHKLTEKNKRMRLAAARKIIAKLHRDEGDAK